MRKRVFILLFLFPTLAFSCAKPTYYNLTVIANNCSYAPKDAKPNNLSDLELTFIADFGYILSSDISIKIGSDSLIQSVDYSFNNGKLKVLKSRIKDNVDITYSADLCDDYILKHNVLTAKNYKKQIANIASGDPIDVEYLEDLTIELEPIDNYSIPNKDKFIITPKDKRFYDVGTVNFEGDSTALKITIPYKMFGCDIEINIPDAEAK